MDILSGSYSVRGAGRMAGHFQVLWGNPDGSFQKAITLKGSDGKALEINLSDELRRISGTMRIATRPTAVDWDADGDLDLVVGNFGGSFVLFKGEGKGKFSPTAELIMSDSKPLSVNEQSLGRHFGRHNSDPVVVDWDGDGDLDLLSSSIWGGVLWAENVAEKGKPITLTNFKSLMPEYGEEGDKSGRAFWTGDDPKKVGSNARIWVADVNGDGKLDITIGDYGNEMRPAKGLTLKEAKEQLTALMKVVSELKKGQKKGEKNNKIQKEFRELSKKRRAIVSQYGTGHVWLFLQK